MDEPAPDDLPPAAETAFHGSRWAVVLGASLLAALTLLVAVRWFGGAASSAEQIVQVPVPVATPKPSLPPELLAPDPGDNP